MNTISPSQLDAMSCRLAWFLGYKRGYSAKRSAPALEFGTGIHFALEQYYGKGKDIVKAFIFWADRRIRELNEEFPDAAEKLLEMRSLGIGMLEGYMEEYKGKDNFDIIKTEEFITRPLSSPTDKDPDPDCSISVRLDGLVRDHQTKKLFSLEHKTFSTFTPGFMDRDQQLTAQVYAGQALCDKLKLKEEVVGVIYNGLRKQLPGPRVKNRLFERQKVYRNANQMKMFLHRAYHQYMEFNREGFPIFPQPNLVRCSQCDFSDVCDAYVLGEDWNFILKELYTNKRR